MRLLVGLGNPGDEHRHDRHNAGFLALDAVASAQNNNSWSQAHGGLLTKQGETILFKPQKFMNLSGLPVQEVMSYYRISPEELCVLADDVYLSPGTARIRRSGGDGGHNGLKSIINHLHDEFWRVRIGVGVYEQHPEKRMHQPALDDYVLQPLPTHERHQVEHLIDNIVPTLVEWLEHGTLQEETIHI